MVIGGLFTDMILALSVFPLIVEWVDSRSKNMAINDENTSCRR